MIQIGSPSNENFKRWRDLSTSKGIRKHGEFILMGEKLIEEFRLNPGSWVAKAELLTEGMTSRWPLNDRDPQTPKRYQLAPALFRELDVLGTNFNLLVLETPEIPEANLRESPQGIEVITPLGDPANLGALVRSALAFGVSRLTLTSECAHPFHPKAVKASAGAVLRLPFAKTGPLKDVSPAGVFLGLDMQGESLQSVVWPKSFRLVVGEEGPGLPDLPGLRRISIQTGPVESLNATVAASIALWEARKP